ncbi:hypothetical protein [Beggiatoa leptomitoformis]|uniref:Uncharacterized protein n=1 Tax=Beggiatoa leptomitoformis TaxID=288004 RepID=A0A2N9YCK4_9GAMM|nr:hypothetical protein [Beggiatoa leptomitoformis]ALG66506.1 hypothetical protein AL038_00605 [Beggiatoa leptomitoformis]AUI68197.1 hypothetical protein BLE401_05440 [Beggiatoa leptomitoformis]
MKNLFVIAVLAALPVVSFASDIENNINNVTKGTATVLSINGTGTVGAGDGASGIGVEGESYGEGLAASVEVINNCANGGCKNNITNKLEGEALVLGVGKAAAVKVVNNK